MPCKMTKPVFCYDFHHKFASHKLRYTVHEDYILIFLLGKHLNKPTVKRN